MSRVWWVWIGNWIYWPLIHLNFTAMGIHCADHAIPLYQLKLTLTSSAGCGRLVSIVRLRTKTTEFSLYILTRSNCSAIANSHTQQILSLLSVQWLHQSLSACSCQWWTFPLLWVPELSPCLSFQLLTATAHNYWTTVLWLTDQLTFHFLALH
jgi:hypothetical protein